MLQISSHSLVFLFNFKLCDWKINVFHSQYRKKITPHAWTFLLDHCGTFLLAGFRHHLQTHLVLLGFANLCFADMCVIFLQIKGFVVTVFSMSIKCHFSNSICSLWVFLLQFGNSLNISNFFIVICYGDMWSMIFGIAIVIVGGHHDLHPNKMVTLTDECSVYVPTPPPTSYSRLSHFPPVSLFPETPQHVH